MARLNWSKRRAADLARLSGQQEREGDRRLQADAPAWVWIVCFGCGHRDRKAARELHRYPRPWKLRCTACRRLQVL